jgi:hypothetical protein
MEPALPAFSGGSGVPAERQHLVCTPGEFHKVLLQGPDTENVFDLKVPDLSVRPFRIDHEFPILSEKTGSDPMKGYTAIEICQYGFIRGKIHGKVVIRSLE